MRASLLGEPVGPAIAVVGVYDPLLQAHRAVFEDLRSAADEQGLASLAIVIDPDPGRLIFGADVWPVFWDWRSRVRLVRSLGVDCVLLLRFTRQDLFATAPDFFRAVLAVASVQELWLGARQLLGSGEASSPQEIARLAAVHDIRLRRLPEIDLRLIGRDVRRSLATGNLALAAEITGRFPIRCRPRSGQLRVAWQPGMYEAVPLEDPVCLPGSEPLAVEVMPSGARLPVVAWPDRSVDYLAFVSGPGDQASYVSRAP